MLRGFCGFAQQLQSGLTVGIFTTDQGVVPGLCEPPPALLFLAGIKGKNGCRAIWPEEEWKEKDS